MQFITTFVLDGTVTIDQVAETLVTQIRFGSISDNTMGSNSGGKGKLLKLNNAVG